MRSSGPAGIEGDRYFKAMDEPGQNIAFIEAEVIEAVNANFGTRHDRFDLPRADCMSEFGQTIAFTWAIMSISTLHTPANAIIPTCRHFS